MARKAKDKEEEQKGKEEEEELDPKELKKKKREEAAEKRRKQRQKDKAARWSGIILLTILMIAGFLMWVSGEINGDRTSGSKQVGSEVVPTNVPKGKVLVR